MDRYNAWNFARSWASVALAQSNDDARPVLYRTTLIEKFPAGIRLVSTDTIILLKAWVPNFRNLGAPEPLIEELPESVAICRDTDHRVLGLMRYVQKITKSDGIDTPIAVDFEVGQSEEAKKNTLEGMAASTCRFHLSDLYDEALESQVFEGVYPNWRPLWESHVWEPASQIGFGADGILRLGKLSGLWDKAVIQFELGGRVGVAKIRIEGPSDVNVTGLVMPTGRPETPPSDEGVESEMVREFAAAFDDWYSELVATAPPEPADPTLDEAELFEQAAELVRSVGYCTIKLLKATFNLNESAATTLIEQLIDQNVIVSEPDEHGKHRPTGQ